MPEFVILTSQFDRSNLMGSGPMKEIQASIAKAKFAELLDDVERGETVVITRHGKAIARLVPDDEEARRADVRRAIEGIKALRKNAPRATVAEILAWRDEGRK
jgi:prevent-host-death family protein